MAAFGKTDAQADSFVAVGLSTTADLHAEAERRMRRGKRLVIGGCVLSVVGVIAYSIACLTAGVNENVGLILLDHRAPLVAPTLGVIGLGTLLWLVGSVMYLDGVMESDPDGPDGTF
ncbi:MAG: hypothetical protein IT184_03995 [Acidobacteria bacterium]|nr:hypothetical protein [Acidobacteriota bacterium]